MTTKENASSLTNHGGRSDESDASMDHSGQFQLILHNIHIKALTGKPEGVDDAVPEKVSRRLAALRTHAQYRRAFHDASKQQDWGILHNFFTEALAHESVQQTLNY